MFCFTGKTAVSAIWKFAAGVGCTLCLLYVLTVNGWADQSHAVVAGGREERTAGNADKSKPVPEKAAKNAGSLKKTAKDKLPETAAAVAGKEPSKQKAVLVKDEKTESKGKPTAKIVIPAKKEEKPDQGKQPESVKKPSKEASSKQPARIKLKTEKKAKPAQTKPEKKQKKKVSLKKIKSVLELTEEFDKSSAEGVRDLSFLPDETFSMEVKNVDVKDVLRAIAIRYGVNFLINDAVKAKVTLSFKDVTIKDAFLALTKDAQIDFAADGNIIRINTYENINVLKKEAPLVTRAIIVKYTFDSNPGASSGSSSSSSIGSSGGSGSSSGGSSNSNKGNNLTMLAVAISSMLSKRPEAKVEVISRTNTILVTDVEDNVIAIEKLIRKLDVETAQIKILARIIEASKDFTKQIGVQWGMFGPNYSPMQVGGKSSKAGIGGYRPHLGADNYIKESKTEDGRFIAGEERNYALPYQLNFPGTFDPMGAGTINLILGKIDDKFLDFQLNTMEKDGLGKILASPKVITQNNQVAIINSGIDVPFQTTNAFGTITISYKKAVIELRVVPHVIGDSIFLDLGIKKNDLDESIKVGDNPAVRTNTIDTRVVVRNGDTVVVGGVISQKKTDVVTGIPYLMDIPYLGWFFRHTETKVKSSELLIFITPEVLKSTEEPAESTGDKNG